MMLIYTLGDGSKEWTPEWMHKLDHRFGDDGAFWMSYEDLLRKYQTFDRTRLFSEEWKVTQQWTSLTIPWTVDYQDTKFLFTLEKKAPVVIVLSQLDGRYFSGLEGQYNFKLSFRVHKAGEEDYIVRSHGNYWMRRSVTAELELEMGEYHVLMKVEAVKNDGCLLVEEVVRKNAKERRDKLLRTGLSYDLAHTKGQLSETDEEKKARKKADAKKKAQKKKDTKERLMKEKRKRKHNENKETRKIRAAASKRKAKAKAKEEKKNAEKVNGDARQEENQQIEVKEDFKDPASSIHNSKEDHKSEVQTDQSNAETLTRTEPTVEKVTPASDIPVEKRVSKAIIQTSASSNKPKDKTPLQTILAGLPGFRINGVSDRSSVSGFDDFDEDDLSDLESNVSDITSGVIEDEIEAARRAAQEASPPAPLLADDDDEDEFERDPWNAVAVVGLRVYSRESEVSVKVVRPRRGEEDDKDEQAEVKLDVDDSNVDALKDGDEKKEEIKAEKKTDECCPEDVEKKERKESQQREAESEGSMVMV